MNLLAGRTRIFATLLLSLSLALLFANVMLAQAPAPATPPPADAPAAAAPAIPAAIAEKLDALEKATKNAQMSGDNSWMLTSSALVLMMTGPGLALFYGGLVRKKNVLGTMMHSFILMATVSVLWAVVGYSLCFAEGSPFIGDFRYVFLKGVGAEPNADYAGTIPQQTWMIYQLMFAIITPALISGAFAERMKFKAMLLFMTLWSLVVYFPMAHMVWGKGGFLQGTLGGVVPAWDFAGGTVVHITSGVSALVCALYMGKRNGYPNESMRPHSVVLSVIGAVFAAAAIGGPAGPGVAGGHGALACRCRTIDCQTCPRYRPGTLPRQGWTWSTCSSDPKARSAS